MKNKMIIRNKRSKQWRGTIHLNCEKFKKNNKHCVEPCWRLRSLYAEDKDSETRAAAIIYAGIHGMAINNADDAADKEVGIYRYLGLDKNGEDKVKGCYSQYSIDDLKTFIEKTRGDSCKIFANSFSKDSMKDDANTLFMVKITNEWIPLLMDEIVRLINSDEPYIAAELMFHAGRLFERACVLPFEWTVKSGAKIKKGASLSGIIRNKDFRNKREKYQADVTTYMKKNPHNSFSQACVQTAEKYEVTERTIRRYVKNPKPHKGDR